MDVRRRAGYKAPGRYPRILDCERDRGVRILPGNALTETGSQGSREQREPPAAGKAVSRPEVKTLPSAGSTKCSGQPCQKQPSMKTATFTGRKTMSAVRRIFESGFVAPGSAVHISGSLGTASSGSSDLATTHSCPPSSILGAAGISPASNAPGWKSPLQAQQARSTAEAAKSSSSN
jgi:hypothetical protein